MKEVILGVLNVTSASEWYFKRENELMTSVNPVVAFALVNVVNVDHPGLGTNQRMIALSELDVGVDLIGEDASRFSDQLVHRCALDPILVTR